jgi:chromosome partitioning protein
MLNHRVDFAASMIDGRTVGEVVPKSASAREVQDLWIYVQDRLCRIMQDPFLVPEHRPASLSINALMPLDETNAADEAANDAPEFVVSPAPASEPVERRIGMDRRHAPAGSFGGVERRAHPFGRRASDLPSAGQAK